MTNKSTFNGVLTGTRRPKLGMPSTVTATSNLSSGMCDGSRTNNCEGPGRAMTTFLPDFKATRRRYSKCGSSVQPIATTLASLNSPSTIKRTAASRKHCCKFEQPSRFDLLSLLFTSSTRCSFSRWRALGSGPLLDNALVHFAMVASACSSHLSASKPWACLSMRRILSLVQITFAVMSEHGAPTDSPFCPTCEPSTMTATSVLLSIAPVCRNTKQSVHAWP
mmetsp:Transcript_27893/g.79965  ORF Transcript_27893/g.79965 Transcript_27893/m.79965 type:complete len:222 (-) Transcript_27893:262-927(-)